MKKFGFMLLLLLAGCDRMVTYSQWRDARARERVGILAHLDIGWENTTKPLSRALAYFRAKEVTRVVILGDPTKNGYPNQMKVFEDAWKRAFAGTTPPERILAPSEYKLGCITFTDEGRFPLTDLLCVHPCDGRRVNAGSMHGFEVSGVFEKQSGTTNGKIVASAQGLLVFVRDEDEGMDIRRMDFSQAEAKEVGCCWHVDKTGMITSEAEGVPKFWDDAVVSVTPGYDGKGNSIYTVRWPPVLAKHTGVRAFSYDVSVGDKVIRQVQSAGFFLPEDQDDDAVRCVVPASELEGKEPRFGITPLSSLGKSGPTIWSR